ncbi:unnamed protein product [Pleuronectes platessa]|uniref:Uncharacterized protein n=1 Tax=Pleuronectes platessa TaxID=8262 RepID=A0A9N7U2Z9_PLEPL|nr:unnamed protein product [Pleuronectes platessa]
MPAFIIHTVRLQGGDKQLSASHEDSDRLSTGSSAINQWNVWMDLFHEANGHVEIEATQIEGNTRSLDRGDKTTARQKGNCSSELAAAEMLVSSDGPDVSEQCSAARLEIQSQLMDEPHCPVSVLLGTRPAPKVMILQVSAGTIPGALSCRQWVGVYHRPVIHHPSTITDCTCGRGYR